ncbi:hypothetical protein CSA17_03995 [bacterium DOLJORAL78_65_58]|nr:MAG: hypothetical protein CSB20_13705 [bacterium DOLZORAL124_64_63]PIE76104.1 MAG: hypothetical protein CSA17_03995 [bacterium DOLJORAL78_65_58]
MLAVLWIMGALSGPAAGAEEPAPAPAPAATPVAGNWFEHTLDRFFGRNTLPGDELGGAGLNAVDPFLEYDGRKIEVIIVNQVKAFEAGWDDDRIVAERLLNSLSRPLYDYTHESVIRSYLLFRRGDPLIPFDLADSERMLRGLPFIQDARILVAPLAGPGEGVAVIVETSDRWPFGATATVIDQDHWRGRVYNRNTMGLGIDIGHQVLHKKDGEPAWGYEGRLGLVNLGGTFWNGTLEYEDSYRQGRTRVALRRPLVHPGLNIIGGLLWEDFDERGELAGRNGFHDTDIWAGRVHRLYDHRRLRGRRRAVIVPAMRFRSLDFYSRPRAVCPDSNSQYRDRDQVMGSVAWLQATSYKTSFLFADGEVEDILSGAQVKLTGVYELGEFEDRPGVFLAGRRQDFHTSGRLTGLGFAVGGFVDEGRLEDGVLELWGVYASPLLEAGRLGHRFYGELDYTLGIRRTPTDRIFLDDRAGVEHLEKQAVAGTRRLVLKGRYRLFTPHSLLGFRMGFFGYGDLGLIRGPGRVDGNGRADDHTRVRAGVGLGVRLRNPMLVLPTIQVHVYWVSEADGGGDFRLGLGLGGTLDEPTIADDLKPGILAYE